ncbi:biotin-dependent carboxyltransferase family protein [Roseateles cellulosilyticus]|uniref:Biotin-dependent carboxyltransferase family protein n=1 Tax=Pelomonas cellulosilytica TaxID=2906762 RepID=A0ABS8XS82_9BURK|nr:biotin-dependent carboxyltransferase family protein [Pelomonas sp. P8]MCE4553544.1 biotin-dependent carboxyltransferase family protein [Pelomonas sp. P8]
MIELVKAGPLATVQDLGRIGWRDRGLSRCGALDDLALQAGNLLLGNAPDAAGLEFTLGPATLRFETDTWVALTGTDLDASLDGRPLRPGWRCAVRAGQVLKLAAPRERMRSYVCVAGGIDVPAALGSRSTDLKTGFGGLGGRALRDGDRLPLGTPARLPRRAAGASLPDWKNTVRVLPGPDYADFPAAARTAFGTTDWIVTPQSNRMGYRLSGPALMRQRGGERVSHGVLPGVVQVPASGQPIVLLADAQTTGGYPIIAVVIRADLWKLAQLRLGAPMRFMACRPEDAVAELRAREQLLARWRTGA